MPRKPNTRVRRCVNKVKEKHSLGSAIAICQSSTKQSYRTGRSLIKRYSLRKRQKRTNQNSKKQKRKRRITKKRN